MRSRILAIVNPIAGRRGMWPLLRALDDEVHRFGARLTFRETHGPGHAADLVRSEGPQHEAILVVGGDGTVAEVINGLVDQPAPLALFPTGTENLLARQFAFATNVRTVADLLVRGREMACDVGLINGRSFVAVCGIGFDAEVVAHLTRTRRGHIDYGSYFWPLWMTFFRHRFPPVRITADGERFFDGSGPVIVGNIARYAMGLPILKRACSDDGLLDICVLPCDSKIGLLRQAVNVVLNRHLNNGSALYRQAKHVVVESEERVAVQIDGDVGGFLPAEFTIRRGAISLLQPLEETLE